MAFDGKINLHFTASRHIIMENRLTDLEIRITHQEESIDELTRTLLSQEKLIAKLSTDLERVQSQLTTVSNIASQSEETPPPHY